jgi:hypothetical protein
MYYKLLFYVKHVPLHCSAVAIHVFVYETVNPVHFVLEPLHHVDVDSVAGISELQAASIFMAKVSRMSECSCICKLVS